jgi:hypothetical protein
MNVTSQEHSPNQLKLLTPSGDGFMPESPFFQFAYFNAGGAKVHMQK